MHPLVCSLVGSDVMVLRMHTPNLRGAAPFGQFCSDVHDSFGLETRMHIFQRLQPKDVHVGGVILAALSEQAYLCLT